MIESFQQYLQRQLDEIRAAGTYKNERVITTPQGATVRVSDGKPVLNFCANNYLGLAGHPAVMKAAEEALDQWGYGLSSVRFICQRTTPRFLSAAACFGCAASASS